MDASAFRQVAPDTRSCSTMPMKVRRPRAKPVPTKRVPGIDKGKIWMAPDFDVLSRKQLDDWYPPNPRPDGTGL